jgi:hypothetical protein
LAEACPEAALSRRFFFCHLQKTGGTALIRRLSRHFSDSEVYPGPQDGPQIDRVISVPHLLARWHERGEQVRLVAGHFPLCTLDLLGGDFTTITILRDPVERTLSLLRHRLRTMGAHAATPLEPLYDDPTLFRWLVQNHMVKMLSLDVREMTHGALTIVPFARERLAIARQRLATIDVVGLQEEFEDCCQEIESRFALRLGSPLFVNLTRHQPVSPEFRTRIARDNVLDVELYESARELVHTRRLRR